MAAQGSLHEPVSQYIDSLLQSYVRKTPTFLLDTTDFIRKIEGTAIPTDSLILSFDVVLLYTNIPHDELRSTLQEVFESRESPHSPTHFLLDLVDILTGKKITLDTANNITCRQKRWLWEAHSRQVLPICI